MGFTLFLRLFGALENGSVVGILFLSGVMDDVGQLPRKFANSIHGLIQLDWLACPYGQETRTDGNRVR